MAFLIGLFKCTFAALALLVVYQVVRLYHAGRKNGHDAEA